MVGSRSVPLAGGLMLCRCLVEAIARPGTQGGTFSANPVAMVAGLVVMQAMTAAEFDRLERLGDDLRSQLTAIAHKHGAAFSINGAASLFSYPSQTLLSRNLSRCADDADEVALMKGLGRFFLAQGVMLPFGAACVPFDPDDAGRH